MGIRIHAMKTQTKGCMSMRKLFQTTIILTLYHCSFLPSSHLLESDIARFPKHHHIQASLYPSNVKSVLNLDSVPHEVECRNGVRFTLQPDEQRFIEVDAEEYMNPWKFCWEVK